MIKKGAWLSLVLVVFFCMPAFAGSGCKNGKFVGTYTRPTINVDVFGDGSVVNSYTFLLSLGAGGTAYQYWTGFPDYFTTLGTGTPNVGSWTCRNDGKLVVSVITSTYLPTGVNPSTGDPIADITLNSTARITYLFAVEDNNTLKRVQARGRYYAPSDDPTDPNGGSLGPLSTAQISYTRLEASDADLFAP